LDSLYANYTPIFAHAAGRLNFVSELAHSPQFQDKAAIRSELADKLVEAEISSALAERISLNAAPFGVSVSVADGKVTLAGTTSSGSVRKMAEKIARVLSHGVSLRIAIYGDASAGIARRDAVRSSEEAGMQRRTIAPHHRSPAEADQRWRGSGAWSR